MFVVSPPGKPDTVYLGGSMHYEELPLYGGAPDISNGRGVIRSTDAGMHWTDMTGDATPTTGEWGFTPFESMHPDQHAMVFDQANPDIWWVGSDGGVIRCERASTRTTTRTATSGGVRTTRARTTRTASSS